MKNLLFLSLLCGTLAGCSSPAPVHHSTFPRVKPELMLIVPAEATSTQADPVRSSSADAGAVLIAPDVIAYPIAGREDPLHRDIMYAGTWAYRRTSPKWRLQPAPPQEVALGPIKRDGRSQIQPVQNQELDTFLLEQRTLNDQNRQAITRIIHLQQDFQKQLADLHRASPPLRRDEGKTEDEMPPHVEDPPHSSTSETRSNRSLGLPPLP